MSLALGVALDICNVGAPPSIPPSISSLSQSSGVLFQGATSITVTGTGFLNTSVVSVNGAPLTTTFNSPTSLQCTFPGSVYYPLAGNQNVTVANGGQSSAPFTYQTSYPTWITKHFRAD